MEALLTNEEPVTDLPRFWEKRARGVQRFVNFAWLAEAALPTIFVGSLLAMAAILVARQHGWDRGVMLGVAAGLLLAALAVSFRRAKRHFISLSQARAKMDDLLGLHTRLSAAAAGVGPWPDAGSWNPVLWRWNWKRLLLLPTCSVALVAAAFLLPVLVTSTAQPPPTAKPPALAKIEEWLEILANTPQIEPESVTALKEEAEQLAKQDPAEWYSHASLEAADHLKAKMQAGVKTLGDNATKLETLLGQSASEAGAGWEEALQQALGALQGNIPGLNSELAKRLSQLDASKFKSLTPEQLEQLKKELGDLSKTLGRHGQGEGEGDEEAEGEGEQDGEGLGRGGVDRGPGTGPLKFGDKPVNLGSRESETLENMDLSRAGLGDALGSSTGQHDVDRKKEHRAAEGGAATGGEGAGAVWQQQNLTPEERKRLQQYFR